MPPGTCRIGGRAMVEIATPLSDEEIATLFHYLARLNQDAACDAKGATRQ
ncbi:hypothetical protein [Paracoccus sediminilitoris]|nr:hypothetical protein [Paracoccus sediminilitoris]